MFLVSHTHSILALNMAVKSLLHGSLQSTVAATGLSSCHLQVISMALR